MFRRKGSILIVTLWTVAILFLLAVGLAYRVGLELRMARYTQERLKVFYIAKAGVTRAVALLMEDRASSSVDAFQEAWSQDDTRFKAGEVGEGVFSIRYVVLGPGGEETLRYGMEDEESRLPLNVVKADVLENIPGLEEAVILSLRAWRGDPDLTPEELASEENYYANLEKPHPLKRGPFETLEEFWLVRGVTPSLVEEMKRFFTVHGSGKVNLNTASVGVLSALGLDEEVARRISELRKGLDGVLGTEDDVVFQTISDLVSFETGKALKLDQGQQLAMTNFLTKRQDLLAVQSQAFRIQVEGRLNRGNVKKQIVAVVDRSGEKGMIQYWHED